MKLNIYNGTIKNRKDLEDILGRNPTLRVGQDWLPKHATIIFAIGRTRSWPTEFGGGRVQREDVLTFWMNSKRDNPPGRFYCCHSVRGILPDEVTGAPRVGPWKHKLSEVKPQEQLAALQMNFEERTSGNTKGTEEWPSAFRNVENIGHFNSLKDALREVYAQMVQLEADYSGTPAAQADAGTVLASERFRQHRN